MKKIASATAVAISLLTAPSAHAGITAQNSSEAAQFSSEAWAGVGYNMSSAWQSNPFPANLVDAIAAGSSQAWSATLVSAYHWTFMTINQVLQLFVR